MDIDVFCYLFNCNYFDIFYNIFSYIFCFGFVLIFLNDYLLGYFIGICPCVMYYTYYCVNDYYNAYLTDGELEPTDVQIV